MLYPAPQRDADLARARISVDSGGALVLWPANEVLAEPGSVVAVHLVAPGSRVGRQRLPHDLLPWVLIEVTDRAPLALPLAGWLSGTPLSGGDLAHAAAGQDLLELSGVRTILAALGRHDAWTFDVQPFPAEALAGLPTARVLDPRTAGDAPVRGVTLVGRVVGLAATLAYVAHGITRGLRDGDWRPPVPEPPLAVLVVLAAALLAAVVHFRRRPLRRPVDPPGAAHVVRLADGAAMGRDDSGDLVLVDGDGRTGWMPGPASGGVASATVLMGDPPVPLHVLLTDSRGTMLAELAGSRLTVQTVASLRTTLEAAGVQWHEKRSPRSAPITRTVACASIDPLEDPLGEVCFVIGVLAVAPALVSLGMGSLGVAATGAAVAAAAVAVYRQWRR